MSKLLPLILCGACAQFSPCLCVWMCEAFQPNSLPLSLCGLCLKTHSLCCLCVVMCVSSAISTPTPTPTSRAPSTIAPCTKVQLQWKYRIKYIFKYICWEYSGQSYVCVRGLIDHSSDFLNKPLMYSELALGSCLNIRINRERPQPVADQHHRQTAYIYSKLVFECLII